MDIYLYFCLHNIRLDRASARKALSAHLSYLRTSLGDVGCENYLVNIRGRGYLLDIQTEGTEYTDEIDLGLILEQVPIVLWATDIQLHLTSVLGDELLHADRAAINRVGLSLADFLHLIPPESALIMAHQHALLGETSHHERVSGDRRFHIWIQPYVGHNDKIIDCIGIALTTHHE